MKRVFAYLRVSGKGQLDGDGFDRQADTILEFCAKNDYQVLRTFREEAVSGTKEAINRPAMSEAMRLCTPTLGVDTIIVERADRLARDLIVSELFYADARRAGVTIIEASTGTKLSEESMDPSAVMIRQMLGMTAEWNKNVTVLRLRAARERIRATGKKCEGRPRGPVPERFRPYIGHLVFMHETGKWNVAQCRKYLVRQTKRHWPVSSIRYWLLRATDAPGIATQTK